jgi:hypothetical protein
MLAIMLLVLLDSSPWTAHQVFLWSSVGRTRRTELHKNML